MRSSDRTTIRDALCRRLGIDARALAAFRIALGVLLLVDLALRARNLRAFYTDAGVLPRDTLAESFPVLSRLSLHAVFGSAPGQIGLFAVAAVFAALLAVGYRTRVVTAFSWLLLASLQARNYLVLNGGDTVLLVVLFLGLLLPLGERWSLDAVLDRGQPRRGASGSRRQIAGFATAALLSQVVLVYATNAVFKLRGDTWPRGEAVRYVFELDRFTVFLGDYLAQFPALLEAINWAWLTLLVASPLLLVATGRLRALLVGSYAGAHLGMALTMELGLFPWVMIAALVVFLPPFVWAQLDSRLDPLQRAVSTRIGVGHHDEPVTPQSIRTMARRVLPVVTATILVVGLLWQVTAVGFAPLPEDAPVDPEDHSWKLFSPDPPATDGWYVVPGELESGERVDLYPHAGTGWDRPPDVATTYPNARWRKYLTELRWGEKRLQEAFAAYLCARGADRHGEPVVELTIYYVEETVRLDGPDERARIDLGTYRCREAGTRYTSLS